MDLAGRGYKKTKNNEKYHTLTDSVNISYISLGDATAYNF